MRAELRALLLVLAACVLAGPVAAGDRVVVGSKNFTESRILGEIMTQLLRARTDLEVEHKSGMGGTLICFSALKHGDIDLYADYTGTGWSIVLKEKEKVSDPLRVYLTVQRRYRELYDIEWLQPFGLNNSYALAMTEQRAQELGVRNISDLAGHAGDLRAGFSIEFMNREDGWPGLSDYYGLELGKVRAMEHGLAYDAITSGTIDLVDAYTTDGKLPRYHLRVLHDDRGFFPPYDAAPIVRGELLRAHPEVRDALDELAFRLPDRKMIELNHRAEVVGDGSFAAVAHEFLVSEGLLADEGSDAARAPDAERGGIPGFLDFLAARGAETWVLLLQHVQLTGVSVLLAALFAIPIGIGVTQSRAAERVSLGAAGAIQTIPSLALLAFMIAVPGLGLSVRSAILALFLYAVLPILRNTITGLRGVDPSLIDAARGMGLTRGQILLRIQLPLATRTIMAGIRTATVISVGVATLAAFIGAGGLGEPIVTGLYLNDTRLILSGAIPAALLALLSDGLLGLVERGLAPRGLRAGPESP